LVIVILFKCDVAILKDWVLDLDISVSTLE